MKSPNLLKKLMKMTSKLKMKMMKTNQPKPKKPKKSKFLTGKLPMITKLSGLVPKKILKMKNMLNSINL